jgi:nucleoside-diphosphate-sugar epimerase
VTRALVIGGAGFIGVAACKELMRRGVETVAAGRTPRPYGIFTSFHAFDRRDPEQLRAALEKVQPDVVLDFSGQRYVFVSTGVYPDLQGKPAEEDDFTPLPGEVPAGELEYREGKRWCETVLARSTGFPWTAIRPPAVFGPDDPGLRIAAYIQRVEDGGPLLVPEESYERQAGLAWVKDVGYACALACDPAKPLAGGAYNVAFEGVSLRRLIEALARTRGRTPELVPIPYAELPRDASPYGPDPARAAGYDLTRSRRDLGFEPSALEDALPETLAWYLARQPSHPGYANRQAEIDLARARSRA